MSSGEWRILLLLCPSLMATREERIFHCVCYLSCNQSLPKLFPRTRTVRCVTRENIQKDNSIYRIFICRMMGGQNAQMEIWKIAVTRNRIGHVIFDLSFLFGGSLMLHFPHLFFSWFIHRQFARAQGNKKELRCAHFQYP
mgnify:CR=1 FL=1